MAVQYAFRPARGAGGVEDHPHRIRVENRHLVATGSVFEQGRIRGVVAGVAADHDDLGRGIQLGPSTRLSIAG